VNQLSLYIHGDRVQPMIVSYICDKKKKKDLKIA